MPFIMIFYFIYETFWNILMGHLKKISELSHLVKINAKIFFEGFLTLKTGKLISHPYASPISLIDLNLEIIKEVLWQPDSFTILCHFFVYLHWLHRFLKKYERSKKINKKGGVERKHETMCGKFESCYYPCNDNTISWTLPR